MAKDKKKDKQKDPKVIATGGGMVYRGDKIVISTGNADAVAGKTVIKRGK